MYKFSSVMINKNARRNKHSKRIYNISNAIQKSVIDKNIIVYRESHLDFLQSNNTTMQEVEVGDLLKEKGFMSTFLYRPKMVFNGKVRLKIKVPRGTHGAYINEISCIHKWENEMLFDKGMRLRVTNKNINKGILLLDVILEEKE